MPHFTPTPEQAQQANELVEHYKRNKGFVSGFVGALHSQIETAREGPFGDLVHSVKWRLKDPEHLREKLFRKMAAAAKSGEAFNITNENLLTRITDLGGYRILHLHTKQMDKIHTHLLSVFEEMRAELYEPPFANIWDNESEDYFNKIGIKPEGNERLYCSVHYVIRSASKTEVTCEVQVRTLADEIWGEIDHRINYPEPNESLACTEQIKVLARVTSSCSRLVDSIMATHADWASQKKEPG
jgi:GTP pyrophosphokinase